MKLLTWLLKKKQKVVYENKNKNFFFALIKIKMSEYYKSSVGSSGCGYATLGSYNMGGGGSMAPVPVSAAATGQVVVPQYGSAGYNTLTHNVPNRSCNGKFNIQNAYPSSEGNCVNFVTRSCS